MSNLLLHLDPDSHLNLQAKIRIALIDAITSKQLPPGARLPSTRQLAKQLGVSRNTVIMATQELIAEGYLVSRERSGCFVNEDLKLGASGHASAKTNRDDEDNRHDWWAEHLGPENNQSSSPPENWQQYPYAFIDGQFDAQQFPVAEWRECVRIVQGINEIHAWAGDLGARDHKALVEQIRVKLLSARGINAAADEILITTGAQGALTLIANLLLKTEKQVALGLEAPGYQNARQLFQFYGADLLDLKMDAEGLLLNRDSEACDVIYTTPSHQYPTTITMSMARRRALLNQADKAKQIIIEDDYATEANFVNQNSPALKALDTNGRVIYIASLSKILAPGLRIGFMVAAPEFIRRARNLRRLLSLAPANNNQHAAALFLSLGHYDALHRRLFHIHEQRWSELRRAVNFCFPQPHFTIVPAEGGTACWIEGPDDLNVYELVKQAEKHGILLDPPGSYLPPHFKKNAFRLSVTSISSENIRSGLEKLARIINEMLAGTRETLENSQGQHLSEEALNDVMPNSALIGQTAYGDRYTAHIQEQGKLVIHYQKVGPSDVPDMDTGHWWIENGLWWRQFEKSTYGEARGFAVVLEGDVIKWFDAAGDLVDTELFIQNYYPESS